MRWDELRDQQCAIARFLSVLGDRWSLLILSDSFLGVRRFETFKARLDISRTTLTERLGALCDDGVLERVEYQERPLRHEYRLTEKGLELYPVVMAMTHWANQHQPCEGGPPLIFEHTRCGQDFRPEVRCSECGDAVPAGEIQVRTRAPLPNAPPVTRGPLGINEA